MPAIFPPVSVRSNLHIASIVTSRQIQLILTEISSLDCRKSAEEWVGLNQSTIKVANPKSGPTPKWLRTGGGRKSGQQNNARADIPQRLSTGSTQSEDSRCWAKSGESGLNALIFIALQGSPSPPTEGNCLVGKILLSIVQQRLCRFCWSTVKVPSSPLVRANQP